MLCMRRLMFFNANMDMEQKGAQHIIALLCTHYYVLKNKKKGYDSVVHTVAALSCPGHFHIRTNPHVHHRKLTVN